MSVDFLSVLQLLIDFGLAVLIGVVQLIVYPSFLFYTRENLIKWHQSYTGKITFIVAPLMIAQLILGVFFVFEEPRIQTSVAIILILCVWVSTFLQFAPIHKKISQNIHSERDLQALVKRNWIRVMIWCLLFLWNICHYYLT